MNLLLTTKRLIISEPTLNDLDNLYTLQSNSEVMSFIGNGICNKNEVKFGLEKAIHHYPKHQFSLGSVYTKDSHAFISRAGLIYLIMMIRNQTLKRPTYCYLILGKGYATELAKSLIQYAFKSYPYKN